jgi:hypothetical protein
MTSSNVSAKEIGTPEERAKLLKEIMAMSQTFIVRSDPPKKPEAKPK